MGMPSLGGYSFPSLEACSACFEQRTVFTPQVLAKALNQMVDHTPLPLLFMRTVIQAIDAYPTLRKNMSERASERTRAAESEEVSEPPAARMFLARRIGGKGRRGALGWSPSPSVGLFMEGLHQCIEDVNEGRWEKGWKEKGRNFSLGKGGKGGWSAMVEALYQLDNSIINKEKQEEMRVRGRQCTEMTKGRSFADAVKGGWNKESKIIRVEVAREELSRNLSRLEHCLIGSWSPNNTTGETLETLGGEMAKAWG
ncbi:hypothetical protein CK203_050207 [Vitis vinifera]|uniref:Symplekin C-terminal domain-containing protein n=1 Tax=Vitis vinifera TaxID=29760 RepID=A0A438G0H5_VITVI|nr:hypothetical protein CK203_050207 [Vitis vinifera]